MLNYGLAVQLLVGAFRSGDTLEGLPEASQPRSADDGYLIQDRLASAVGLSTYGWKVGLTTESSRQAAGMDEPMVGLDPRSVRLVKDLLRSKARAGQTIFMSTHLLGIAEEIADRVGIVDQGRLRFLGTIQELREALATHETSLEHLYLSFTAEPAQAGTNGHPDPGSALTKEGQQA